MSEIMTKEKVIEAVAKRLCLQTEGHWEDNEDEHGRLLMMAKELVNCMEVHAEIHYAAPNIGRQTPGPSGWHEKMNREMM